MAIATHLLRAGVGLGAAVMGAGALIYECAMNTRIYSKFIGLFDHPDPAQTALYTGDDYADGQSWFAKNKGEDKVITTEKTGRVHGYVIPAEGPSHRWALLLHGYNSAPEGTALFARHYHEQCFHCVVPSLRGWGNDETHYCTMAYFDKDVALAWLDYIIAVDPQAEVVIHGYSMGAATTMLCTGENLPANVQAAVSDCGFTSAYEQYAHVVKSYTGLPSFPLLNAFNAVSILRGNADFRKCRPIDAVARSVTPTIFLHGTADDFVPYAMMDRLYEACAAPKAKQPIQDAMHATSVVKDPDTYWKAVDGFLRDKL